MYFNVWSEFKACLYLFLSFSLLFIPLCRWPTICYIIAYEIIHLFFISQPSRSTVHEKTNLSATSAGFLGLQPELRKSTLKGWETSTRRTQSPRKDVINIRYPQVQLLSPAWNYLPRVLLNVWSLTLTVTLTLTPGTCQSFCNTLFVGSST